MLPCCGSVRGLDGEVTGDVFFAPESMPLRGETSALRTAHDLERDFGPNEGGGGAFLKLRGKLAESRQGALAQRSNSLSPAPGQSPPGAPGAGTSSPQGFGSIGSSISSLGSFVSIGNSISALGSNLGVPLNPPAQTTLVTRTSSPTGILKSGAESPRRTAGAGFGGDTQRSSVSTRPLSYRESARSSASAKSSRRPSGGGAGAGPVVTTVKGQLPDSEIKQMTAKVGELVRSKQLDARFEPVLMNKIGNRDAHILMVWTVYQCNGDDQRLVEALVSKCDHK